MTLFFDPGGDALLATQIQKISQGLAIKVALTQQIEGAKGDFTDLSSTSDPEVQSEIDKILNQPTIGVGTDGKTAIHVDEVDPSSYVKKKPLGPVEQGIPQSSVLFVFLFPMFLTSWIREEQEAGLLRRLLSTPVSKANLIVGKLVFGVLVCTAQLVIIFLLSIIASEYKGYPVSIDIPGFLAMTLAVICCSGSDVAGWIVGWRDPFPRLYACFYATVQLPSAPTLWHGWLSRPVGAWWQSGIGLA